MSQKKNSYKYVGEGNAHIVVEELHTNNVLRLFKEGTQQLYRRNIQLAITFVNTVMMPLLIDSYGKYDVIET
jgi:hypothetical protein